MSTTKRKKKKAKEPPEKLIKITPTALTNIINRESKKRALAIYERALKDTEVTLFKKLMVLPAIVLMDSYSKITPKKGRIKTFLDLVYEQYTYIENGEVKLDELCKQIEEECEDEIEFFYDGEQV